MMNFLGFAMATRLLRKSNLKQNTKSIKKDILFVGQVVKELVDFIAILVIGTFKLAKYTYKRVRSFYCKDTVSQKPSNVIDLNEYKNKKAQ